MAVNFYGKEPLDTSILSGQMAEVGQEEQGNFILNTAGVGRTGRIGKEQIDKALTILTEYKQDKEQLEARIVENEQWYRLRHWEAMQAKADENAPKPASAWLFNTLINKHADVMDNYPEANVLPRMKDDEQASRTLSDILPIVLERCEFEQTYSDVNNYKLKNGTGIYGVFWNSTLENGLGDIDIKQVDILNIFWDMRVKDIQKSRNLFTVEMVDNDVLVSQYPFLEGQLTGSSGNFTVEKYAHDFTTDETNSSPVFDWYYKITQNNRSVLHYCKFVAGIVIYASENDPQYFEHGYYAHGKYPFVFDTLFGVEGVAVGFGYVDVGRDPQMYVDKLNQMILANAFKVGSPRHFVAKNANINVEQYADWSQQFVEVEGSVDDQSIRDIRVDPLPSIITTHLQNKIEELKETTGNTTYAQGSGTQGVTSASGIVAMQEASGKLSRNNIKGSYRAFVKINYLALELIRQFYEEPRMFRITGKDNKMNFVSFDNTNIRPIMQQNAITMEQTERLPIFDIKVSAQRQSAFHRVAQNELAVQLYQLGIFNPQNADQALMLLDMMEFEGKESLLEKVQQGKTMLSIIQTLSQAVMLISTQLDRATGSNTMQQMQMYLANAQMAIGGQMQGGFGGADISSQLANLTGAQLGQDTTTNKNARARTASTTAV